MEDNKINLKEELKMIRDERKKLEIEKESSPQKRKVEVIEYEDGTYSLIGYAWNLKLSAGEVSEAVESWVMGDLEKDVKGGLD